MKKALLVACLIVAINLVNAQLVSDSIYVDGNYRTFHYYRPDPQARGQAVIFILHGSGGNGRQMIGPAGRLQQQASAENLLLIYADGYKNFWNECRKMANSDANLEDINEQAFFQGMLAQVGKKYGADTSGFYAIGMSGGGHMAYKLAITLPQKCKGICAIVANVPEPSNMDCVESNIAVPVMIINGTKDNVNPYNGGEMRVNGSSFGRVRSTENSLSYWAKMARYNTNPRIKPDLDTLPANGQSITRHIYEAKGKPRLELLEVIGGTHDFPKDLDAFIESWTFFKSHHKPN